MSEEEKRQIVSNLREQYREAKSDLATRREQARQWADGFEAIAVALRSDTPDRMAFVGDLAPNGLRAGDHPVPLADYPTKDRLQYSAGKLSATVRRVVDLEQRLRSLGEWPVD